MGSARHSAGVGVCGVAAALLVLRLGPAALCGELDELGQALIATYKRAAAARPGSEELRVMADLEAALRRYPRSRFRHRVRNYLAKVQRAYGNYDKAQELLREGLADDPPPRERGMLGMTLAEVFLKKGDAEGALRQLEITRQFVHETWLQGPARQDPNAPRREALRAAWGGSVAFLRDAERVWRELGRLDLAGRAWLDAASFPLTFSTDAEEQIRWRAMGVACSRLAKAGDCLLEAGDLAGARSAYERAFSAMQAIPPSEVAKTRDWRLLVTLRRAYTSSDKCELGELLRGYAREGCFPNVCLVFAHKLPARERLDFVAAVLSVLPEDWASVIPASDQSYVESLYTAARDTAFELGLNDEAVRYARELERSSAGSASVPGLLGPLGPRPQQSPKGASARKGASTARRSAPRPPRDRSHHIYTPSPEKAAGSVQRATAATRPSSQPASTSSAVTRTTPAPTQQGASPVQESPGRGPPIRREGYRAAATSWDARTVGIVAGLAVVGGGIIAYLILSGRGRRTA